METVIHSSKELEVTGRFLYGVDHGNNRIGVYGKFFIWKEVGYAFSTIESNKLKFNIDLTIKRLSEGENFKNADLNKYIGGLFFILKDKSRSDSYFGEEDFYCEDDETGESFFCAGQMYLKDDQFKQFWKLYECNKKLKSMSLTCENQVIDENNDLELVDLIIRAKDRESGNSEWIFISEAEWQWT